MPSLKHIPFLNSIQEFFELLRFGNPTGIDISVTRIEDQPSNKVTEVPLFRSNIYRIIYLDNADVQWDLTDTTFSATDQCIYFAHPGKLESWKANPENQGFVICFSQEFLSDFKTKSNTISSLPFFSPDGNSILYLSLKEADLLKPIIANMYQEMQTVHPDREDLVKYQLSQLLLLINRIYGEKDESVPSEVRNNIRIFKNFKKALDQHFVDLANSKTTMQVSVSIIANNLSLTPGYLGAAIKEITGRSAVHHINEKTILEAKSYLLHTDLQMSQIAHKLGFNTISYFNRFFKKHTQTTPKAYRRNVIASRNS